MLFWHDFSPCCSAPLVVLCPLWGHLTVQSSWCPARAGPITSLTAALTGGDADESSHVNHANAETRLKVKTTAHCSCAALPECDGPLNHAILLQTTDIIAYSALGSSMQLK